MLPCLLNEKVICKKTRQLYIRGWLPDFAFLHSVMTQKACCWLPAYLEYDSSLLAVKLEWHPPLPVAPTAALPCLAREGAVWPWCRSLASIDWLTIGCRRSPNWGFWSRILGRFAVGWTAKLHMGCWADPKMEAQILQSCKVRLWGVPKHSRPMELRVREWGSLTHSSQQPVCFAKTCQEAGAVCCCGSVLLGY